MKIATVRTADGTSAARVDGDTVTMIAGFEDAGALLRTDGWSRIAANSDGPMQALADTEFDLLIAQPSKVLCVGLNYRKHILEMGRELPEYPTVFAKFADTLTAPFSDIVAVSEDSALDWEGELALVIGKTAYQIDESEASDYVAGYTIANDISMRTWQNRTLQWLQGKMWARSTPVGPFLMTADEFDVAAATLRTRVNDRIVQEEELSDLLFTPTQLVAYLSTIIPLNPGDLILTGTPGGVGHARKPAEYLTEGDVVEVEISGLGTLRNRMVAPA